MRAVFAGLLIAVAGLKASEIPSDFFIEEKIFTWAPTYEITTNLGNIGKIKKTIISLANEYTWTDERDLFVSYARQRLLSLYPTIDVYEQENNSLGTIEQHIFTWSPCKYSIYNFAGDLVATATMNFWRTTFSVCDLTGKEVATLERPFFNLFKTKWHMTLHDFVELEEAGIDPRLVIFCGVYFIDLEHSQQIMQMQQQQQL